MDDKLSVGKYAFIIESNRIIPGVIVIKVACALFIVSFIDSEGAVRVRKSRLYRTEK